MRLKRLILPLVLLIKTILSCDVNQCTLVVEQAQQCYNVDKIYGFKSETDRTCEGLSAATCFDEKHIPRLIDVTKEKKDQDTSLCSSLLPNECLDQQTGLAKKITSGYHRNTQQNTTYCVQLDKNECIKDDFTEAKMDLLKYNSKFSIDDHVCTVFQKEESCRDEQTGLQVIDSKFCRNHEGECVILSTSVLKRNLTGFDDKGIIGDKNFCCNRNQFVFQGQCTQCTTDVNCAQCKQDSKCILCDETKSYLQDHQCVQCEKGHYGSNSQCLKCSDENCERCYRNNTCVLCSNTTTLVDGICDLIVYSGIIYYSGFALIITLLF